MNLFLSPHCDDECLFGAYTIMREHPQVVVVFDGQDETRRVETEAAMTILGASVRFLGLPDAPVPAIAVRAAMATLGAPERIWVPAVETGGNVHHNLIGEIAAGLWQGHVMHYLTYTNLGKSTGVRVDPINIYKKLMALSCYTSQIERLSTREHFMRDLWEYVA